jgi:lipopolysaccharide transport system ATP-binding protein
VNSDIIIRAEGLGKRYQLGQSVDLTRNFREALAAFPRKLARLARHKTQHALDAVRTRTDAAAQPALDPETPPGTFWALRDVSFEIKRGEVVGIIGRNGAGKSTLLKVLSRITSPTHGYAEIHGRLASLLEVGTGFHPELTGRENIYLNGAILGMHKAEITRKFDEIVAFAEVEKFLDTPVKRYSSGMYVRLAFAVAAHLESEVLIVDEVLAVGDASFQKKCLGRMDEVAKGGRTVLFVSHNMAAIMGLCSFGIMLNNGRLAKVGSMENIAAAYNNDVTMLRGQYDRDPVERTQSLWIKKIAVLDSNGPSVSFVNSDILHILLEIEVYKPLRGAQIAFDLYNDEGVCLLSSSNLDDVHERALILPGNYQLSCDIPLNMYRSGKYSVKFSSSIPNIEILDIVNTPLVFELHDICSPAFRLRQIRRGLILPVYPWSMVAC